MKLLGIYITFTLLIAVLGFYSGYSWAEKPPITYMKNEDIVREVKTCWDANLKAYGAMDTLGVKTIFCYPVPR